MPEYLLLAVCAVAAPWSPEMRGLAKEKMPRLAGVPFFLEARRLMFDGAGHLLSPSTLATAQALCLLEMHEVAASHSLLVWVGAAGVRACGWMDGWACVQVGVHACACAGGRRWTDGRVSVCVFFEVRR